MPVPWILQLTHARKETIIQITVMLFCPCAYLQVNVRLYLNISAPEVNHKKIYITQAHLQFLIISQARIFCYRRMR